MRVHELTGPGLADWACLSAGAITKLPRTSLHEQSELSVDSTMYQSYNSISLEEIRSLNNSAENIYRDLELGVDTDPLCG